ncbi:MAG: hypothetical protein FD133_1468 [Erysipelotrichaceae bacterium]|nr:MAG: hypothetical protein FD179_1849 [Erysipelotrichaceae bacterium]TXT17283.1 MAG: hypothetical protein FD133_1468 [Erysipelotrichaceae bacterium]
MEENKIIVTDEQGKEYEMTILFTYEDEANVKKYVFYYDDKVDDGEVFVSQFTDQGELFPVEDDEVWTMLNKVLEEWQLENNDDEEEA